jgi:hypothetical protein
MLSIAEMNCCSRFLILGTTLLALDGCVNTPVVLDAVGPVPKEHRKYVGEGRLIVFTAAEEYNVGDTTTYRPHSAYHIHDGNGKRFKYVLNHTGVMDEMPQSVLLPAGNYTLRARAERLGWVIVPVLVKENQSTEVHLDSTWKAPPGFENDESLVRLPSGQIVGWRASQPSTR